MRAHLLLGAAAAAALLMAGFLLAGPAPARGCVEVRAEVEMANAASQDAMERFDDLWLRARRDASIEAQLTKARQAAEQTKRDLDAVRAEVDALCP